MADPMPPATRRRGPQRARDIDHHIAARLRQRRTVLGLTQQQVAEVLGVTYQQAHKYETGANRVSAGRLHQLARALGVEPGYFYEGLGSGERPRPTARQRQTIELARSFAALPRPQQEALCGLARALAGTEAPAEVEEEAEETARDAA
jgi:transcriptional regulator with XRE-family HTH domain